MNSLDQITHEDSPILRPSLEYAAILAMLGILILAFTHYLNIDPNNSMLKAFNWISAIVSVFWFVWHYKNKRNNSFLRFGTGIRLSALTGLFTGIFSAIGIYIFMQWIVPNYSTLMLESTIKNLQKQGQSDQVIEQSIPYIKMFITPIAIAGIFFIITIFSYLIIGLVATAIMKKERA
jgi:Protein of unknown function (DUF4199)